MLSVELGVDAEDDVGGDVLDVRVDAGSDGAVGVTVFLLFSPPVNLDIASESDVPGVGVVVSCPRSRRISVSVVCHATGMPSTQIKLPGWRVAVVMVAPAPSVWSSRVMTKTFFNPPKDPLLTHTLQCP